MKFEHFINTLSLEKTLQSYYQYDKEQLKLHLSKWKEVEVLGHDKMISHEDINELITGKYQASKIPLTLQQRMIQTEELLKITDEIIEPQLKNKMK